jgi:hypothetical protein
MGGPHCTGMKKMCLFNQLRAAYNGRMKTVEIFLLYGAELDCKDNNGKQPVDVTHHPQIKQLLNGNIYIVLSTN